MAGTARSVVVGVDGSASSTDAVTWAARECARQGSVLGLVHHSPRPVAVVRPQPSGR